MGINKKILINKYEWWIFVIFLLMTRVGFLIPDNYIVSVFRTSDIAFVIALVWGAYILWKFRSHHMKYDYKIFAVFIVLLIFVSSYQSLTLFGQNFMLGFRAQRYFLICWFLYFPVLKLFECGKINFNHLQKAIFVVAVIQLVLFYLQYLLGNYITFLDVGITERYGARRLYGDCTFINLAYLFSLTNFLNGREKKKSLILILVTLFYYTFVRQGRMITMAALACLYVGGIFTRQRFNRKFALYIGLGVLLIVASQTKLMQDLINAVMNSGSDQNINIRLKSQEFYLSAIKSHWFIGYGYVNSTYEPAALAAGLRNSILFVDNGIFGFAYQYGMLGLAWVVSILVAAIIYTLKHFKNKDYFVFLFIFRWVLCYATNVEFYYEYMSISTVILVLYMEFHKIGQKTRLADSKRGDIFVK